MSFNFYCLPSKSYKLCFISTDLHLVQSEPVEEYQHHHRMGSKQFQKSKSTHLFPMTCATSIHAYLKTCATILNAHYASRFTTITQQDRHTIIHAKKSLLYCQYSLGPKTTQTICLTSRTESDLHERWSRFSFALLKKFRIYAILGNT